ncbi:TAXI family TRAP transporter solute-binding subunit [Phormidesmis priestleyi]
MQKQYLRSLPTVWQRLPLHLVCGVVLLGVGSCNRPPDRVTISSGTASGYYSRLAAQIGVSAGNSVGMNVQNLSSQGSRENLQRLLDRQADFALVQLDVVSDAMKQGKVQAIATLANEDIHVIVQDARLRSLSDLQNKRVGVGSQGSGIRFTADQLVKAIGLKVRADDSGFEETFKKLSSRQVDAVIYVGSVGASDKLRQQFLTYPKLRLIPLQPEVINYLATRDPGSYQAATIAIGTYGPRPAIPAENIPTLSTATVLVTRPDVDDRSIGLLTWSILSTSRKFSQFYPDLQAGDARSLLQKGLFYIHPAAQNVYEQGDPRDAWIRYWESNSDLQAGLVILIGTSSAGVFLQKWRRDRSKKLVTTTVKRISELRKLLPLDAQQAIDGIEELSQEHRLLFIEGTITSDVYEQVRQKTQTFSDQCRTLLEQQRKRFVLDTLLLLDDWQASLQVDPQTALQKLTQIKQQYREMLIADQVDIQAYIELMELTLISVMTLAPRNSVTDTNGAWTHPEQLAIKLEDET